MMWQRWQKVASWCRQKPGLSLVTETALHLPRLRPVIKNMLKQVVEIHPFDTEFFL